MGDFFQMLVFRSVGEDEAVQIGERLRQMLLERQIIAGEPGTEPVLDGIGYRPGPGALVVCIPGDWQPFQQLRTNGVEIQIGRRLFHAIDTDGFFATCEACQHRFDMLEHEPAMAACTDFVEGGAGDAACPNCGQATGLADWNTEGFAAGFLGLTFWNWWPLDPVFHAELAELAGSEILTIESQL